MKDDFKRGYIYKLSFCKGKYNYIGSTTQDIKIRYNQHVYELKTGRHGNTFMKNLYNKYGEEPVLEIMEVYENSNKKALLKKEQEYIDSGEYDVNICKIAGLPQPVKTKVVQYSMEGNFIKVWDSAKEAAEDLKIHAASIRNCTYNINKSAGNFQWKKWEPCFTNKINRVTRKTPKPPIRYKTINIYDLYGILKYKCVSRKDCEEKIGIPETYIHVVKNKKLYQGYFICDEDMYNSEIITIPIRRVGKYDMQGNLIKIYGEPTEAMKEINKPNSYIFAVLKGKQKSCFGYTYRYIDNEILKKIKL